jgi:hypothetical protein
MFMTLRNSLGVLRKDDRGENSLMVVISQNVSLLVMAALAGMIFLLLTGGNRIQAENGAQTELRIANRAFINDVDNAATVYVQDDTKVTLSSTKFLQDPNDATKFLCRASSWYIAPAADAIKNARQDQTLMSLYNDITVYKTASCDGDPKSTQHRTAVAAIKDDSTFTYENVAKVPLQFSNGIVTNMTNTTDTNNDGVLDPIEIDKFRADHNVAEWYTDEEAIRELPRTIQAKLTAVFPITEDNPANFVATTNEAETELVGDNDDITDPGGEQTRWIPNAVNGLLVTRTTDANTGTVVGNEREGLKISWNARPGTECSPTQTITYSWLVKNVNTNKTSSGQTTGTIVNMATGTGGNAEVWNGGKYDVAVSARCNDIDGQSGTTTSNGYILSLPDALNMRTTPNANETAATVNWSKVSSNPNTEYTVTYAPAVVSNNYSKQTRVDTVAYLYSGMPEGNQITGSPTKATTITKSGNTVTRGFPDTYFVQASTENTKSPNRAPANYIYRSSVPGQPNIWTLNYNYGAWRAIGCDPGNTPAYRVSNSNTYGGANTTSLSGEGQRHLDNGYADINQGSRVWLRVDARCDTKYTLDPTNGQSKDALSPWGDDATTYYDRPIDAGGNPGNPRVDFTGSGNGNVARTSWNDIGCPTGTNRDYYHEYTRVNSSAGQMAGSFIGGTSRDIGHSEAPGSYYEWHVQGRCYSAASGNHMEDRTPWSAGGYYTSVPNPSSPSITRSAASVPNGSGATVYANAGGCVANTSWVWSSNPAGYKSYSSPGTRSWSGSGYCVGANGRTSGSTSDSTSITWYTPAPSAPSSLSMSGYYSPTQGGAWMLVSLSASAGGSSNASSYTAQVRASTIGYGYTGWVGSLGCTDNTSTIQARGMASGPGGSSAWTTGGEQQPTSLTRVNGEAC